MTATERIGEVQAFRSVAGGRVRRAPGRVGRGDPPDRLRLAGFPADTLNQPAPHSPTGNSNETIGSLLATIMFHQAYHVGQTAVLRRLIGKPGAIK